MAVSAKITLSVRATQTGTQDLGSKAANVNKTYTYNFTDGGGADQVDKMFIDTRTVNAESNDDLDLAGSLTDAFGATITFTTIKAIIISAAAANPADLVIGAEGTNDFDTIFGDASDTIIIPAGGTYMITDPAAAGFAVTAGTGDMLRVANSTAAGACTYDIIILGD